MSSGNDYSGSFTRNPEAGAVLRPHNTKLSSMLVPSSAYNNYDNAKFRPSNPALLSSLKHHATDTGREVNVNVMKERSSKRVVGNQGLGNLGGGSLSGGDAGDVLSTIASFLPFLL